MKCHLYVLDSQDLEVTSVEAAELLRALCDLQLRGFAHFRLGQLRVHAHLRPTQPGDPRLQEFELLWEQLLRDKAHFEQDKARFESSVRAGVARERREIEKLREDIKRELRSLKIRLQQTLKTEKPSPLPVTPSQDCEDILEALRREAGGVRVQSAGFSTVQRELDYAEDLLVRVRNGEDEAAFHSQVEVLKAALIQAKAQRVVTDTEKLAQSIGSSIRVLQIDRRFSKSKANVLRKVLDRVSPSGSSLSRSPDLSFESRKPPGLSQNSQSPVTDRSAEAEKEDGWRKHVTILQDKLDRCRSREDTLSLEKSKVKGEAHEVALRAAALELREEGLAQRETALALLEDRLRTSLSKVLTRAEAREFLRLKAAELVQLRRLLETERTELANQQVALQAQEMVFAEHKRELDRRLRKVAWDQTQIDHQSEKIRAARKEVEAFLNKLS